MENTTVNVVNAAKTTLWQSNVWNLLNGGHCSGRYASYWNAFSYYSKF